MKSVIVSAAVLGLSHLALATPAMSLLQQEMVEHAAANHSGLVSHRNQCTDFSGKWKGKCTAGGQSQDAEVEIKQTGCSMIQVGNDVYAIGGLKTDGQSGLQAGNANVSYGMISAFDWNADQTQITANFAGLVRAGQAPTSVSGSGTVKIDSGRLVEDLQVASTQVSCSLDKE